LQHTLIVCCCNWWTFKYWVSYSQLDIHYWNIWTVGEKLCKVWFVICEYSMQVHLKNWTLKFKLIYLLNHISYFNKICKISFVNTRLPVLNIWLISVLPLLKYRIFFLGDCFIGAPCIMCILNFHFCRFVLSLVVKLCKKNLGGNWSTFFKSGSPFCHLTDSVKALKDLNAMKPTRNNHSLDFILSWATNGFLEKECCSLQALPHALLFRISWSVLQLYRCSCTRLLYSCCTVVDNVFNRLATSVA